MLTLIGLNRVGPPASSNFITTPRLSVVEVEGKKRCANVTLPHVRLSPIPPQGDIYYIDRMRRYSLFDDGSSQSIAI